MKCMVVNCLEVNCPGELYGYGGEMFGRELSGGDLPSDTLSYTHFQ